MIEYLKLCTEEALRDFQKIVPIAVVPVELFSRWEDEFDMGTYMRGAYKQPTYSTDEIQAILAFESIIAYSRKHISGDTNDINVVFLLPWWPEFKTQAAITLAVFMKRGKLSDDVEELNR